jgi:exopolysaccharide biosynthesis polyprenyl glycosylphosphotransferase
LIARILAQYIAAEMVLLGVFELTLSFVLIDIMLMAPGLPGLSAASIPALSSESGNLAAILALTLGIIAATIGLYRPEALFDRHSLLPTAAIAGLIAFPADLAVIGNAHLGLSGRDVIWLVVVLGVWLVCILLTRLTIWQVLNQTRQTRRLLVVGSGPRAERICEILRARRFRRFEPIMAGDDHSCLTWRALRTERIWGVVLATPTAGWPAANTLLASKLNGIRVFDDTRFYEHHLGRLDLETIDASWLLAADGFEQTRTGEVAKRALDLIVSCSLLTFAVPVMLVTAAFVKLESPGPVFYRQQRSGLRGTPFTVLKFRSMTVDAEAAGKPCWAEREDPRITRVGSIIRPMRIDELPQLINVLRGDMSMIGPRPERPHFVEQLSRVIPLYTERSFVKPGLTGWAQVNFPYGASVEDAREKLAYDLFYVKNRNLLLDLLILLSTVRVILFREGGR